MMNVLTDILYDSASLMTSHNFKETSQNKIISSQDVSFKQKHLHQLNPISQIQTLESSLSLTNHSSMDIYNSHNQIHISSNMDTNFEDGNDVSVFSDSFPEIVPSWLTQDFMKASENLSSPDILSNVSDIYPSSREDEHLEMLDLGFPSELNSQNVTSNELNRTCIAEGQKLLVEPPIQIFSNNNPLLMSSFNNVHITDLNSMQYQKFKQNTHQMNNPTSSINSVLSCENDLLHLPLHSNLNEQCLTTTSSPSMMSNSQSQSHPVDVACDKLPRLNLNHLDSLLSSKAALSNIQLLRHDFPMSGEVNYNRSHQSSLDDCSPSAHSMGSGTLLNPNALSHTQDASVQVAENAFSESFAQNQRCYSCCRVSSDAAIDIVQCFKCKFCDYVNMHKCAVESHINTSHSESSNIISVRNEIPQNGTNSSSSLIVGDTSETHLSSSNNLITTSSISPFDTNINNVIISAQGNLMQKNERFQCIVCKKLFLDVTSYNSHLISGHNINPELVQKDFIQNTDTFQCIKCSKLFSSAATYKSHLMSDHNTNLEPVHIGGNQNVPFGYKFKPLNGIINSDANHNIASVNSNQSIQNPKPSNSKQRLLPKRTDGLINNTEVATSNSEKSVSSHKEAWKKKLKRELGTYICEFKGCNIRFRALDNLEYHNKCHVSGGSSFACPECGMCFENWGTIAGHMWRTHKNDMELHACDQCPFRTYSLSHLEKTHKRIHLDECSFLCDTCGKGFKNGKQMRNHRVRCHFNPKKKKNQPTAVQDFKCKFCQTYFSSRVLLHHHQDTVHNLKVKSFMCNHCDFTTLKKSTLTMHMRQHTGEKPFECDQCDYRTSDHNSLRRHKMIHSGEKQYKCPFCSYSAIQASSYKEHMKKHPGHNGVMFSCEFCSFRTLKRETYILHVKDHESLSMLQNANSMSEMNTTEEIYPLAEAMDISLSYGDNNLIPHLNKNKNMQSFFSSLGINLVSVGQESAT